MSRRRVHVPKVQTGVIALTEREARHVRDVLRMEVHDEVELFDDEGAVAAGKIVAVDPQRVSVEVDHVSPRDAGFELIVAAAVPKGDRADWMVEKLSELGVARFVPLQTERSVVLPQGKNKIERWSRIATEAAKQSRRMGVMRIDSLTPLDDAVQTSTRGIVLSKTSDAQPLHSAIENRQSALTLFVGPEGGWSDAELERMTRAGLTPARLTATILRVETAAVAAAAVVATVLDSRVSRAPRASDAPPETP